MGIFDDIKSTIWGHAGVTTLPGAVPPATAVPPIATTPGAPVPPSTQPAVDVSAVLTALAAKNPQPLNWQTSIVDLLKLLNIDSGFQHRVALAKELGYTGSQADSAAMNTWLQRQVMDELASHGGTVPDELRK